MSLDLEELAKKEITTDDFKKMKFRGKLKCYAYDWACHIVWWPGWVAATAAPLANSYFTRNNYDDIIFSGFNGIFKYVLMPVLAGAMAVSALRTAYWMASDYRRISNGKQGERSRAVARLSEG
jgi:uncharacterized membrane protein